MSWIDDQEMPPIESGFSSDELIDGLQEHVDRLEKRIAKLREALKEDNNDTR